MRDIKLTKNFKASEVSCKGSNCCGHSFPVSYEHMSNMQRFRELVGKPIRITSCFRCIVHNRRIGGSSTSGHTRGVATDCYIRGYSVYEMRKIALKIRGFKKGSIGIYPSQGFIHVATDYRGKRWTG